MKNVIVLGCGRSGTSMVAGCLAQAGYFMGDDLLPANASNPKGFFESIVINSLNEDILDSVAPSRPEFLGNLLFKRIPLKHQRWLLALPDNVEVQGNADHSVRIKNVTMREPYCFKDPRFSYTLPVWQPFLKNVVFLVVFREPMATANSIIKECKDSEPLHSLSMNRSRALKVWHSMYTRILSMGKSDGNWLFLHFNQVIGSSGLEQISRMTGAEVDTSFPDKRLRRSLSNRSMPGQLEMTYRKLCEKAHYAG